MFAESLGAHQQHTSRHNIKVFQVVFVWTVCSFVGVIVVRMDCGVVRNVFMFFLTMSILASAAVVKVYPAPLT